MLVVTALDSDSPHGGVGVVEPRPGSIEVEVTVRADRASHILTKGGLILRMIGSAENAMEQLSRLAHAAPADLWLCGTLPRLLSWARPPYFLGLSGISHHRST